MNALARLKAVFGQLIAGSESTADGAPPNVLQWSYASLNELNELIAEQRRLGQLKRDQMASETRLQEEIDALDARRIGLLTDALVDNSEVKDAEAQALAEQIAEKRRQHADAAQIAAGIDKKIHALDGRREELKRDYLRDLGHFLDGIYAELAAEYGKKAQELAEIVLQIGALQEVMLLYRTGNSNGFERRIYLPQIVAGQVSSKKDILDGDSAEFRKGTAKHQQFIREQLVAAGFVHRFD